MVLRWTDAHFARSISTSHPRDRLWRRCRKSIKNLSEATSSIFSIKIDFKFFLRSNRKSFCQLHLALGSYYFFIMKNVFSEKRCFVIGFSVSILDVLNERKLELPNELCSRLLNLMPSKYASYDMFRDEWPLFKIEVSPFHPSLVVPAWTAQILLLPLMAFERYLLICHPARVNSIYSKRKRILVYCLVLALILAVLFSYERRFSRVPFRKKTMHKFLERKKPT